jgi:hypothetical protein
MLLRHQRLSLSFKNKPAGIEGRVSIYVCRNGKMFPVLARRVTVVSDRLRTRVTGTVIELSITYLDPKRVKDASVVLSLHLGK